MNVGEFLDKYNCNYDEAFCEAGQEATAMIGRRMGHQNQRGTYESPPKQQREKKIIKKKPF
jgi:hypothetical protein